MFFWAKTCTRHAIENVTSIPAASVLTPQAKAHTPVISWIQIGCVAALVILLYARVLLDMEQDWWTQPNLSHGFLIPPLALYIAWMRREGNPWKFRPFRAAQGLILTAIALLMFLAGKMAAEFFLQRTSFVLLLAGLTWTFLGKGPPEDLGIPLSIAGHDGPTSQGAV